MTDIASLGFEIDSTQAESAATNLDKLTAAGKRAESATERMQRQAEQTAAGVRKMSDQVQQAYGQLGRDVAAYLASEARSLSDVVERRNAYTEALKVGALSADQFFVATKQLAAQEKALKDGLLDAAGATSHFNLATSQARVELGRMFKDIATGQYERLAQSATTLTAQTGLLSRVMSALVSPFGVVLGIAGTLGAAWASITGEESRFNQVLASTGNVAGVTVAELEAMKDAVGSGRGEYSKAAEALTALAASGKFFTGEFQLAAQTAVDFSAVTGESIEKSVKAIESLADAPTKAVAKLSEQYHFLTLSQYEYIAALEHQGDKEGATVAALQALDDAMKARAASMVASAGIVSRAWHSVTTTLAADWNTLKEFVGSIGSNSIDSQLQGALAQFQRWDDALAQARQDQQAGIAVSAQQVAQWEQWREAAKQNVLALENQGRAQTDALRAQSEFQRIQQAGIDAESRESKLLDEHASKADKLAAAVKVLNQDYLAMLKAWLASAQLNPFAGFIKGFNAIGSLFGGGDSALKNYVTRFAEIENEFGKTKRHADDTSKSLMELASAQKAWDDELDTLRGKLDPAAKAQADYDKGMRELQTRAEALAIAGGDVATIIKQWQIAEGLLKTELDKTNAALAQRADVLGRMNADVAEQLANIGKDPRTKFIDDFAKKYVEDLEAQIDAGNVFYKTIEDENAAFKKLSDEANKAGAAVYDAQEKQKELQSALQEFGQQNPFEKMHDQLVLVTAELEKIKDATPGAFDPKYVQQMIAAQGALRQGMLQYATHEIGTAISSFQSMAGQGTKAYKELQVAQDALNLTTAIGAIVNQGLGDPYTAFARIAAMAAIMATLVHDIGSISGGGPSPESAQVRQAQQGTGTVLGDEKAQSDSIAKAVAITADATTALVGLNRGMLNALQSLEQALGAAGVQLARGAGNVNFPAVGGGAGINFALGLDPTLNNLLFGGSKKVIDQGIVIAGGSLQDMLNGIVVGAYETIHKSGGLFGSSKTYDVTQGVSSEFTKQFQLVIDSIVDAVKQGALALGISQQQIDAAIAAYHVAEQHISLKGLSAADQQKALEAVFSSIFDGLAGAVVPFIGQFQKVGEGLGETLVRVATEVQVMQQAMKSLGLVIETTDPEKFAQISDALVNMVGGVDAFITDMNNFVDKFASDSDKFTLEKNALTSGLSQVGLTLPSTREGFYDLMKSLDASTDAGRQQIAELLRLTNIADAYYTALDNAGKAQEDAIKKQQQAVKDYEAFITPFRLATDGLDDFEHAMLNLGGTLQQNIAQANALARAAGMQGASAEDIAKIIQVAAQQGAAAFQQLEQNAQQLASTLYGQDYINGLESQLAAAKASNDTAGYVQILPLLKQIGDAQKNQQQGKDNTRFLNAQQLAAEIGEIVAVGGGSIGDTLKTLGIPFDAFAKDLHLQSGKLTDFLQNEVDKAKAQLDLVNNTSIMSEYLKDIRDILAGHPLSNIDGSAFDPGDPNASPFGNRGAIQPHGPRIPAASTSAAPAASRSDSAPVVAAVNRNTEVMSNRIDRLERSFGEMRDSIKQFGLGRPRLVNP